MWKNKTICIVFPAFNEEVNIRNAIQAFYANSYVDKVIVVDNNSTDNTKDEILKTEILGSMVGGQIVYNNL